MTKYVTTHLPEEEIDRLRLKAFATNDPEDKLAYYKATSLYFQERHERAVNEIERLRKANSDMSWELNPDRMGGQFTREETERNWDGWL